MAEQDDLEFDWIKVDVWANPRLEPGEDDSHQFSVDVDDTARWWWTGPFRRMARGGISVMVSMRNLLWFIWDPSPDTETGEYLTNAYFGKSTKAEFLPFNEGRYDTHSRFRRTASR